MISYADTVKFYHDNPEAYQTLIRNNEYLHKLNSKRIIIKNMLFRTDDNNIVNKLNREQHALKIAINDYIYYNILCKQKIQEVTLCEVD